jgi:tetratricopeptide (TPR) repeat protein
MNEPLIAALLKDLHQPDQTQRDRATQQLWQIWFEQKGALGLERLRQAQMLLELGDADGAEAALTQLIADQSDFAEAWNRRAVLYYVQKRYRAAIVDCQQVVRLNPVHFGAFHGLGLCYMALSDYAVAIGAFRQALEIQPYATENQRWILECTAKLS